MKKPVIILLLLTSVCCNAQDTALHRLFDNYYQDRLKLFPLFATAYGDDRYNDILPIDGSTAYIQELNNFYSTYLAALSKYEKTKLNAADRISWKLLKNVLQLAQQGTRFHLEYMPFIQIVGNRQVNAFNIPLTIGIWGAGKSIQPFKTFTDYRNWLSRIAAFKIWVDTAIANFDKGINAGIVLPEALVIKMIPQMQRLAEADSSKSIFYGPVRNFPVEFTEFQRAQLRSKYYDAISNTLVPAYAKLAAYLQNNYLPHATKSAGINALPAGDAMYRFFIRFYTTTNKAPEEFYREGIAEVARIHRQMETIRQQTGFNGPLDSFFHYLVNDPKFLPFNTADEVKAAYIAIRKRIEPLIPALFGIQPKSPLEIRETEAFRAASSVEEYFRGTKDRPAIFYFPVTDATKYPSFSMEDIFLHEGIPGHHFQFSLSEENNELPAFRKFLYLPVFTEGWGLYSETLGKQLGLYADPYQYMGFLEDDIHRAIRLVVDIGIHTGKMTREQAIAYMVNNEPISEALAASEIERYMAWPGQALSYKTGELKILELRNKYQKQLGKKFDLRAFHDTILMGGQMTLDVFEQYMDDALLRKKTINKLQFVKPAKNKTP